MEKKTKEIKTPEYTRRAINNYTAKFDVITVRLPKGTRERIAAAGSDSINAFIAEAVIEKLGKNEK